MSFKHRMQAYGELWGRYSRVFTHFWKERDKIKTGLFRESEAEFLPAALSLQETPPSNTARLIAWLLMLIVLTALAWSIIGEMDVIVNASGKIISSERIKTIASVETGKVSELLVEEGKQVKAGQTLLQLDTSVIDAERDKATGDKNEAVQTLMRNESLLDAIAKKRAPQLPKLEEVNLKYGSSIDAAKWQATEMHVRNQYQDYASKLRKFSDLAAHQSRLLPLATQQAASYKALYATQDVSRDAWQEKERTRLQIQADLQDALNQANNLTTETSKIASDQIGEARRVAAASGQDALRAASSGKKLTITSPVDGTVQQLTLFTVGGVVQAAQPIMQIVPSSGPIEVEAFIENKDRGYVQVGQTVSVKVDTFEYTKYGTLPGKVIHVSQDAIPQEKDKRTTLLYSVKVLMDKSTLDVNGKDTPITPGMAVNVEIKTGTRRIIEYALNPLLRHTHEAMSER